MIDMNINDRYEEIAKLSGLSEDIVRRVLKASKQSIAKSLAQGNKATLPGICTLTPEIRSKIEVGKQGLVDYVKVKAKASASMESEVSSLLQGRNSNEEIENKATELNFISNDDSNGSDVGIRLKQINALL